MNSFLHFLHFAGSLIGAYLIGKGFKKYDKKSGKFSWGAAIIGFFATAVVLWLVFGWLLPGVLIFIAHNWGWILFILLVFFGYLVWKHYKKNQAS